MLQPDDFSRENWEAITWRIVSVTYVTGYILSECLPPQMYFDWLMERMGREVAVTIQLQMENTVGESGPPLWKLTIRQAGGPSAASS
jgi:hypothetical protein